MSEKVIYIDQVDKFKGYKGQIGNRSAIINNNDYLQNEVVSSFKEVSASEDMERRVDKMSNNDYITEKELKTLEERLEQKIKFNHEMLVQKLDSTKNEINLKFDKQILEFKDLLNTKFNEQKEKQTANNRWLITTVVACAAALFGAMKLFL